MLKKREMWKEVKGKCETITAKLNLVDMYIQSIISTKWWWRKFGSVLLCSQYLAAVKAYLCFMMPKITRGSQSFSVLSVVAAKRLSRKNLFKLPELKKNFQHYNLMCFAEELLVCAKSFKQWFVTILIFFKSNDSF